MAYGALVADKVYITVVETLSYLRKAEKLLSESQREDVVTLVAEDPECGVLLRGTGGVRKVRLGREGGGKSGGFRVVYFFHDVDMPVYLLTLFAKNAKSTLSQAESNQLRVLTRTLVSEYKGDRNE